MNAESVYIACVLICIWFVHTILKFDFYVGVYMLGASDLNLAMWSGQLNQPNKLSFLFSKRKDGIV